MIEVDGCPVCHHHGSIRVLYKSTYSPNDDPAQYFLTDRSRSVHEEIRKCGRCGFVFTGWQFTPTEYETIYSSIKRKPLSGSDIARYKRLMRAVTSLVPTGMFIEIGGGDGTFTDWLNQRGYMGQNIEARDDFLTLAWGSSLSADFIVAWDVLEHIPRLHQYMLAMRACLRPEGKIIATLPNVESLSARLLGNRWPMLLLEHLWYFSPRTLSRYAEDRGLRLVSANPIPYDVSLRTISQRLRQSGIWCPPLPGWTVPLPVGNMLVVLERP